MDLTLKFKDKEEFELFLSSIDYQKELDYDFLLDVIGLSYIDESTPEEVKLIQREGFFVNVRFLTDEIENIEEFTKYGYVSDTPIRVWL